MRTPPLWRRVRICQECGEDYMPKYAAQKYCSLSCSGSAGRRRLKAITPQRMFDKTNNYWAIRQDDGSYVPEHRLIWEQVNGIKLEPYIKIAFRNKDPHDLRPENLYIRNNGVEDYLRKYGVLPKQDICAVCETPKIYLIDKSGHGYYRCRICINKKNLELRHAREAKQRAAK